MAPEQLEGVRLTPAAAELSSSEKQDGCSSLDRDGWHGGESSALLSQKIPSNSPRLRSGSGPRRSLIIQVRSTDSQINLIRPHLFQVKGALFPASLPVLFPVLCPAQHMWLRVGVRINYGIDFAESQCCH